MTKNIFLFCIFMTSIWSYSQQIVWTGNATTTNFFDENNWENSSTNLAPTVGTIDPNKAINLELKLHNTSEIIVAGGIINLGTGSLSVTNSSLQVDAFSGGNVSVNKEGYIDISESSPFQNNVTIDFTSGVAWVRTLNLKGATLITNHIAQIKVNQQPAMYQTNIRLDNYYLKGTVIRSIDVSSNPLEVYDHTNLRRTSATLALDVIHSGTGIANTMDNKIESFILKKGYMATFAIAEDGTGKSKNYIALEEDLIVNRFPHYLLNAISFIRVVPWNWVTKKGIGGNFTGLDEGWFYKWNNNGESTLNSEYVPMTWGGGGANDDNDIDLYRSIYKATHVLAFNESDNCNDQSGQYGNLCQTDVAVDLYKNLMKTGLRLVSPSGRESAPFDWLKEFHKKATEQDIRIDVIGVHWYDWGSNPANSPNENPTTVFNRFTTYLQDVHDLYKLPIWITEFNANPNRVTATSYGFMQLALPYLESLDSVERYAWFQPNALNGSTIKYADYYDTSGTNLTNVGLFYKNQNSTPAIPEATITANNNIDIYQNRINPDAGNLFVNGYFETGNLSGWTGSNIDILSSAYEGTTAGRIKANAGSISQIVAVESAAAYDLSFYAKWFVAPSAPISIQILNASTDAIIATKIMTTSTVWNLVALNFTVPNGVTSIKFKVEKGSSPGWFIDNAFLIQSNLLGVNALELKSVSIYPNPTSGNFTLKGKIVIVSYELYNVQGQLIKNKKNIMSIETEINISEQTEGIYFLKIKDVNGNSFSEKIILNY